MTQQGKKLRAVLVGCGNIANAWLDPIGGYDDVEIVGLVDINVAAAEKMAADRGLAKDGLYIGDSISAGIKATGADAVFDCTVPSAHPKVTIEALECGCHVLGEKPMAETLKDARKMVAAAEQSGRVYAVIQNRRHKDSIVRFRNLLKSGRIGSLHTLNADFYLGPHFGGFREEMRHVLLADMAIHSFDQARFLTGADPVSVFCMDWNPRGSWFSHGASAVAMFKMSDGLIFCYRGSWCAQGFPTSWECEWRAIGTQGSALWNGGDKIDAEVVEPGSGGLVEACVKVPEAETETEQLKCTGHAGVIREFVDCVLHGGPLPQTICTDNIKSLAMVDAAIESAETGGWIEIKV